MMEFLDMSQSPRQSHFAYFRSLAYPYAGLTVMADVTALYRAAKARGASFFLSCLYCAARAANEVPELRQRIVGDRVAQFDHCDTTHTVALDDGTYCYCRLDCRMDFDDFLIQGSVAQEAARNRHGIDDPGDETDLIFVSCIPWVTYTALTQPVPYPADSNPRITFGKFDVVDEKYRMPVTLLVNHALADGRHITEFFQNFQREADAIR